MTGESLSVTFVPPGDSFAIALSCSPDGSGTIVYAVGGLATGPFSGTFIERGTVVVNPSLFVTALDATFTIVSGSTTVSGSKHLDPALAASARGLCSTETTTFFDAQTLYAASIQGPNGTFHDEGSSSVSIPTSRLPYFGEAYVSSLTAPAPVPTLPASKSDCMKGGWQPSGLFKNQGDCVSFVSNGKH